jgi:hypothetical protein
MRNRSIRKLEYEGVIPLTNVNIGCMEIPGNTSTVSFVNKLLKSNINIRKKLMRRI